VRARANGLDGNVGEAAHIKGGKSRWAHSLL
jgi:hypothetical protein